MNLRIVEVEGARYAVQECRGIFGYWGWLSLTEYYIWPSKFIEKYCLGTLEQAEQALEIHIKEIMMKREKPPKAPRIVKVIKTIRV
jgi:hypothetical protein